MKLINTATNEPIINDSYTKTVQIRDGRWVEMPIGYDPSEITDDDICHDSELLVIDAELVDDDFGADE